MNRVVVLLAMPIIFAASQHLAQAQENCNCQLPRMISVTGTAEVNIAPDEVVLSFGVESRDKMLSVAKSQNDARIKKVMALSRAAGVEAKDIKTSALQMGPEYSDERIPHLLGYQVSQTIAITLKDLSKYEGLMTQLLEAGVNRVDGVNFRVGEPRKYRDDARAKAIAAAKEKAIAMAAELGQKVGNPWEVTEQDEGGEFFMNLATRQNVQYAANSGGAGAEESTVAPGQVTIHASVKVSFQLE